jgi:hypothetical protein
MMIKNNVLLGQGYHMVCEVMIDEYGEMVE